MPVLQLASLIHTLPTIAREAGAAILGVYATDFAVQSKPDESPVTQADQEAEALITARLRALTPDIPLVAEEAVAAGQQPALGTRFWLVDPLDGTREFVNRNGEFTVNIALVENGTPVLGVVYAPVPDLLYAGGPALGSWLEHAGRRQAIACRPTPPEGLTVLASRSHGDAQALQQFLAGRPVARVVMAGSSLKLCRLAAGEADVYPRLGRTMAWDIAAGHAVLLGAGGHIDRLDGQGALRYGDAGLENPHFVAWGLRQPAAA